MNRRKDSTVRSQGALVTAAASADLAPPDQSAPIEYGFPYVLYSSSNSSTVQVTKGNAKQTAVESMENTAPLRTPASDNCVGKP